MTRAELVEYVAWKVRGSGDVRKATLDLLSELDRSPKWRAVADRAGSSPAPAWGAFLSKVQRRVEEIR